MARFLKEKTCHKTGQKIAPGEECYRVVLGAWDGESFLSTGEPMFVKKDELDLRRLKVV